jgi:stage II sporulation protein AA (anti-sigma F factor antagonist)
MGQMAGVDDSEAWLSRDFDVHVSRRELTARVTVSGEVDIATAEQLYGALTGSRARGATVVVADLSGVTFIDSTGLRALLTANEGLDGRLRLIASPACTRLLELVGLTGWFAVADA